MTNKKVQALNVKNNLKHMIGVLCYCDKCGDTDIIRSNKIVHTQYKHREQYV